MKIKYKNNPLNIRYDFHNKWIGQIGSENGFCCFSHIKFGVRAAAYLLMRSYRKVGVFTLADIIYRFAPLSENPTESYLDYMCMCLHQSRDYIPHTVSNYAAIIHYMWKFEQGVKDVYPTRWIVDIIKDFKIVPYERKKSKSVKE